jgi:hypothetical protein
MNFEARVERSRLVTLVSWLVSFDFLVDFV